MSTFGSVFELSSLNGTNGFQINGGAENDLFGFSVASAGDVDGDGFADLIIGSPSPYDPSGTTSGAAYVVFGREGGFAAVLDLTTLNGSNGFQLVRESAGDGAGTSVASAGDVNGDGFADLIVGARRADGTDPDGEDAGASYVVFGKADGFGANLDLSALDGTNGFQISGEAADDFSGLSVASAGDVNGDGFGDLIIGAAGADANFDGAGASYVVFGKADGFAANLNLSAIDGNNGFQISGEAGFDYSGESVSTAGDVNGDGLADLIIGASKASANGFQSGVSYVVFGKESGFAANLNLSTLDGSTGFQISGEAAGDLSGGSVAAAGDVNGDGFGDLIIGASLANANGDDSGASYVVFGKAGGFGAELNLSTLDGGKGFRINGETEDDRSSWSVASAGDVNGDGFGDLIIGAYRVNANGTNFGASYVVFGKAGGFGAELNLSTLGGTSGFQISGEAAGDYSGNSVAAAGDVNGDGFDDLIVGAVFADPNGSRSGASYVIFGKATAGTARDDVLDASGIADRLSGLGGNDTIRGNAGADTLNGGDGNGLIFGGTEGDILVGGAGNDLLDGGSGVDSLYGGSGNDVFLIDSASDVIRDGAGIDEVRSDSVSIALASVAVAGVEHARLTGSGNLGLSGTAGANILTGNSGNNSLDGLGGADTLTGGAGSDTYVTDGGDAIIEAAADSTDTVLSSITLTLGANLENLALTGVGGINGTGNALVNKLTGNGAANVLNGGTGADVLIGGAGNDIYITDGGDAITEGADAGTDTVQSSATLTLGANLENLILTGSGSINGIGNTLANTLTGNAASNTLDGGGGTDTLIGGAGESGEGLCFDEVCEIVIVPGGGFQAQSD